MSGDRDFLRQIHFMALLDKLFRIVTPIFCALVLLGALAGILARTGVH